MSSQSNSGSEVGLEKAYAFMKTYCSFQGPVIKALTYPPWTLTVLEKGLAFWWECAAHGDPLVVGETEMVTPNYTNGHVKATIRVPNFT